MTSFVVFMLIIIAASVLILVKGVLIVKQSENMVIERLGKYRKTLESGINFVWPILETPKQIVWRFVIQEPDGRTAVRRKSMFRIDMRETFYDFPGQSVITKDNVLIEINALLSFQIIEPVKVVYAISNLPDALEKLTQTTLRNVMGEMDLDETLASRDRINLRLRSQMVEATEKWGVKVNRVELQDIIPPQDIRDAMEKQMRAERDKRASILEAEGFKQSQIKRAEGERQSKILLAEGDAISRMRVAQAEADAINKVNSALEQIGTDPSTYLLALRYIDALKEMATGKNTKVVYLPYEASGILGSIGAIKDLFKDGNETSDLAKIKRDE